MKKYITSLVIASLLGLSQVARADVTFGQNPNTDYWSPVSPEGTHVYANSFVAQSSGDVASLGTWLNTQILDASTTLMFQVLGSVGGNPAFGPTIGTVFASTGPIGDISGSTAFYSGAATSYTALVAGQTYWFAINAIGGGGIGEYQVSSAFDDLNDGGSFWYSNSVGVDFDGQGLTPEMAFSVTLANGGNGVPQVPDTGSSMLMLLSAVIGLAAVSRKLRTN